MGRPIDAREQDLSQYDNTAPQPGLMSRRRFLGGLLTGAAAVGLGTLGIEEPFSPSPTANPRTNIELIPGQSVTLGINTAQAQELRADGAAEVDKSVLPESIDFITLSAESIFDMDTQRVDGKFFPRYDQFPKGYSVVDDEHGQMKTIFEANGGTAVLGRPISQAFQDENEEWVQYFDHGRISSGGGGAVTVKVVQDGDVTIPDEARRFTYFQDIKVPEGRQALALDPGWNTLDFWKQVAGNYLPVEDLLINASRIRRNENGGRTLWLPAMTEQDIREMAGRKGMSDIDFLRELCFGSEKGAVPTQVDVDTVEAYNQLRDERGLRRATLNRVALGAAEDQTIYEILNEFLYQNKRGIDYHRQFPGTVMFTGETTNDRAVARGGINPDLTEVISVDLPPKPAIDKLRPSKPHMDIMLSPFDRKDREFVVGGAGIRIGNITYTTVVLGYVDSPAGN